MHWIAPSEKDPDNATLEKRLWAAADQFRANSGLKSQEYSAPVLGLIFLRFAEVRFAAHRAKLEKTAASSRRGSRLDEPTAYHAEGILYLPPEARFDYLLKLPEAQNIGAKVNAAMRDIEKQNTQLAGVLPKTYNLFSSTLLKDLFKKVSEIPDTVEYDAFGRIYEYFLGEFARTEGQKGGEFYTPACIVRLLAEIIEPYHGRILDPACGSGGMFVQSARFVAEHKKNPAAELSIHGHEKVAETMRLCRMNLAIHGLEGDIREAITYYDDPHRATGQFDFVLANPPFNVNAVDKERLKDSVGPGRRYPFGLPRTDNANYLWIQLFYSALNEKGRAGFVMANSASDARSSEQDIRRQLIENRAVDAVVAVGPNMFYTVTLPCTLWFLDRGKAKSARKDTVLFIDARHINRQVDRAHRDWIPAQIGFLANIVRLYRGETPDFTLGGGEACAKLEEIFRKKSKYADVLGLCRAANREVYAHLKEGIKVSIPDTLQGGQKTERARVVDWEDPANNDFLLVSQFSVTGALYTCRPDLTGFVNGLPLVVMELKKPGVPARAAFDENLTHYKQQIPALFWYNALLIASNGTDSRVGSLTADWERFFDWKRIEREEEPRRVSLEVMIRGTCDRARLLDLVENFTLFSEHKAGLVKIIGQNHQFLGVNNAIASMLEARKLGHGRGGVFWQTQGSGKSFSMVFFAQKVLRKVAGNWTFVVVTDRVELDDQIAKTFKATGAVSEAEGDACHAASGAHLRELLRGNHRYVFTLIHKFQTSEMLCDRSDVIVLSDEAHRSQYDTLALNMRAALPKALFLAFTGTPLIAGEERTKDVFGDYVSIYDFQQSVEDGATVPLFYENRTPELQLINPDLNEDIYDLVEAAELDPDQEAKLERELSRQYHILTRDDRLETVAQDIVRHFLGRGFIGKAMVVSIDKATALKIHDKVRKHWDAEAARVKKELAVYDLAPEKKEDLLKRMEVLSTTDMALIVSPGQNEIEQMRELGLDITPHRKRMNGESLDEKFKDPEDPLRLVFLCAMWLTGFDAPSCSVVYLDKPMRNHTLMQTIARANRVFPGKHSGVIVDYSNVFASLEKALAIYGAGKGGKNPVKDKKKLVEELRKAIDAATVFCAQHGVVLPAIEQLAAGSMARLQRIDDAVNALISPDPLRREFLGHDRLVRTLYGAVKPDPVALEFLGRVACLAAIANSIRTTLNPEPPDITEVMGSINELLDSSITGAGMPEKPAPVMDLSKIDFEALRSRFKESRHKNTDLEVLKAAIRAQLEKMIRLNKTRADFAEKFEELIESYNNGSRNIEDLFQELLNLSHSLSTEQQRHVREQMTEEELVIFDILTRPAPELSPEERAEVKKVARELLNKLKQSLVLNWRRKSAARSQLKLAIEDVLDTGLPRIYTPDLYRQKCSAVFEHVYESYPEAGQGIYADAS